MFLLGEFVKWNMYKLSNKKPEEVIERLYCLNRVFTDTLNIFKISSSEIYFVPYEFTNSIDVLEAELLQISTHDSIIERLEITDTSKNRSFIIETLSRYLFNRCKLDERKNKKETRNVKNKTEELLSYYSRILEFDFTDIKNKIIYL